MRGRERGMKMRSSKRRRVRRKKERGEERWNHVGGGRG